MRVQFFLNFERLTSRGSARVQYNVEPYLYQTYLSGGKGYVHTDRTRRRSLAGGHTAAPAAAGPGSSIWSNSPGTCAAPNGGSSKGCTVEGQPLRPIAEEAGYQRPGACNAA